MQLLRNHFFAFDIPFVLDLDLRLLDHLLGKARIGEITVQLRQQRAQIGKGENIAQKQILELATLRQRIGTDRFQIAVNIVRFDTLFAGECYERFYGRFFFFEFSPPFV